MSTASLNYPEVIRVQHTPALGRILILGSIALIAITVLVMVISAQAELMNRASVTQNLVSAIPVPVPTPPPADSQPAPSATLVPSTGLASGPSVVPVPVPTPPTQ